MTDFVKLIVSLSLSGGLLCMAILLCDSIFKRVVNMHCQYYIWLVPLLRFIIPFSPRTNLMNFYFLSNDNTVRFAQNYEEISPNANDLSDITNIISSTKSIEFDIYFWLTIIFITVSMLLLVQKIVSYRSFARFIKIGSKAVTDKNIICILEKTQSKMKINKRINIYENPIATSPMILGLLNPIIILPHIGDEKEIYYTLRHELTHLKRADILYKWLVQFVQCVHWFNPMVYIADYIIRKKCELSCDYKVISDLSSRQCREYGDTILQSIKTNGNYGSWFGTATLSENAKNIKERLEAIMNKQHSTKKVLLSSFTLATGIIIGAVLMGSYNNINKYSNNFENVSNILNDERYTLEHSSQKVYNSSSRAEDVYVNIVDESVSSASPSEATSDTSSVQVQAEPPAQSQTQGTAVQSNANISQSSSNAEQPKASNTNPQPKIQGGQVSSVDEAAVQVMYYSGSWSITEMLLPYMSLQGIETVVSMYNEKNPNNQLSASDYSGLAVPSQSQTDSTCYNLMQNTGNWTFCSPLFPYMSNNGILNVVTLYNQKTGKGISATDYYN